MLFTFILEGCSYNQKQHVNPHATIQVYVGKDDKVESVAAMVPAGVFSAKNLNIQSAAQVANDFISYKLKLDGGMAPASQPVQFSSDEQLSLDKVRMITASIPFSSPTALGLTEETGFLAIVYQVYTSDIGPTRGIIAGEALTGELGIVKFNLVGLGNYQAVWLQKELAASISQPSEWPNLSSTSESALPTLIIDEPIAVFQTSNRQIILSVEARWEQEVLPTCIATLDKDRQLPMDYSEPFVWGVELSLPVAKNSATRSLYARLTCLDAFGRVVTSRWSEEISVPGIDSSDHDKLDAFGKKRENALGIDSDLTSELLDAPKKTKK
jgi:hypothetical protein